MRKITTLLLILSILYVGFLSGCNEQHENIVNMPLDKLGLKIEDLDEDFEKIKGVYITEPHTIQQSYSPLKGQKIQEYYNSTFKGKENVTHILEQNLFRCESNEKAKEYFDIIKSVIKENYPEQLIDNIGEKTYFGVQTATVLGMKINSYFLVFCIGDVLVLLGGITPTQDSFISYGKKIESNIMDTMNT